MNLLHIVRDARSLNIARQYFSTATKIPIQALKKLREETSAPMGECKKALEQNEGHHDNAMKWLKAKGLMTASKRQNRETREGVISAFVSPCRKRLVLLQANCETDFVAKNQMFLRFVTNLSKRILSKDDLVSFQPSSQEKIQSQDSSQANLQKDKNKQAIENMLKNESSLQIFPEDKDSSSNAYEQLKILISRLQENIRIRRVVTLHSERGRFGTYVHQSYTQGVGLQACVVQSIVQPDIDPDNQQQLELVGQFTDNIATQILGAPPKYLKAQDIPEQVIAQQADNIRAQMQSTLQRAPENMHDKIIAGKLNSVFYEHCFLPCMSYVLSNDGITVSKYWEEVEAELGNGREIVIESSKTWQCK